MITPEMKLPLDLIAFLESGEQLEFDPETCDSGEVSLLSPADLQRQNFPAIFSSEIDADKDPHRNDSGRYLVQAVSLLATCEQYDPAGMILWLPLEQRYGAWDSDHLIMHEFAEEVTWGKIVADPGPHLEASTCGEGYDPPFHPLEPWHKHPYVNESLEGPQPFA